MFEGRPTWIMRARRRLRKLRTYILYYATIVFYRMRHPRESVFRTIYRKRTWGGASASGGGSDLSRTTAVRAALPALLREIGVRTMLDAPCGDYHWMSHVRLDVASYVGVDIVPELISENRRRYATGNISFVEADIRKDPLPRADLILCRDCMVHLSHEDIFRCLQNFKRSGSTYLLATTHPGEVRRHWNIITGMWRPLDLQLPPFNFPEPLRLLDDHGDDDSVFVGKKCLALWRIDGLPI